MGYLACLLAASYEIEERQPDQLPSIISVSAHQGKPAAK